MIDLHSHILPHVDDGAKSTAVARELLHYESEQGIKELVFTPHYYGKRSLQRFLEIRSHEAERMKKYLPENLRTRLGAEVHVTGTNDPTDDELCTLAIEGTKCVLLEFPVHEKWSSRLFERLSIFMADTGYTPIIAHVERYEQVLKDPSLLTTLAQMGCLLQINTGAFLKRQTKRFALAALKKGLVHALGSDAHDLEERRPRFTEAKAVVYKAGLSSLWEEVQRDMRRILAGEIPQRSFGVIRRFMGFYF